MPNLTRRELLTSALAGLVLSGLGGLPAAFALGDADMLRLGMLRYPGAGWDLRPGALDQLLIEMELVTSVLVAPRADTLSATDDLREHPLIFVSGDREFAPWAPAAREALRRWLQAGGMLVFDSSEDRVDGGFHASARREVLALLPDQPLERLPASHVLFKSFYLCRGNEGRRPTADFVEGVHEDGRLKILYSHNDLLGAWSRDASGRASLAVNGGERGREMALRFGVNILMYALTHDYKEDQVHVPFLLRRRRWRVP